MPMHLFDSAFRGRPIGSEWSYFLYFLGVFRVYAFFHFVFVIGTNSRCTLPDSQAIVTVVLPHGTHTTRPTTLRATLEGHHLDSGRSLNERQSMRPSKDFNEIFKRPQFRVCAPRLLWRQTCTRGMKFVPERCVFCYLLLRYYLHVPGPFLP